MPAAHCLWAGMMPAAYRGQVRHACSPLPVGRADACPLMGDEVGLGMAGHKVLTYRPASLDPKNDRKPHNFLSIPVSSREGKKVWDSLF